MTDRFDPVRKGRSLPVVLGLGHDRDFCTGQQLARCCPLGALTLVVSLFCVCTQLVFNLS